MGLFDFLKPKKDWVEAMMERNPGAKRTIFYAASETVSKQAGNLRAVGRKEDADKLIAEFLEKVFQEFRNDPENPRHLSLLTNAAITLDALDAGKHTLESIIEGNEHFSLDLTLVFTDLGRIYHQLGNDPKRNAVYELEKFSKNESNRKLL